ncbi:hypothetical protein [Liquorilactobacillus hordei]|uniref:hypothetical protein n=1 Tax=Liquorilactobacillus hordei TaxID=468911 RepID=UPI001CBB4484|nr:hypothetical protein [Liquorilactobacillus hordei]MBZ2406658.1 hypothetical protein [Liquorilactobacillus hordei]
MNEIRLIVRFATKPEKTNLENGNLIVRCRFQALDEDKNYITIYMSLEDYMFFFGSFNIVLTDSYYIEAHFTECIDNEADKKAYMGIKPDRIINTTEGRFGDKTLENVRRHIRIRTVPFTSAEDMALEQKKLNQAMSSINDKTPEEIIEEIIKKAQTNNENLLDDESYTPELMNIEHNEQVDTIKANAHGLLPEEIEKEKKKETEERKVKKVEDEGVDMEQIGKKETGEFEDDLPMGNEDKTEGKTIDNYL